MPCSSKILGIQVNAMKMPETNLAGPPQIYNTLKQITRKAGLEPEPHFTDPSKQPPKPPQPKPEEQKADGRNADGAAEGAAGCADEAG